MDNKDKQDLQQAYEIIKSVKKRQYDRTHVFMTEKEMLDEVDRLIKVDNPTVKDFARYTRHFILTKFMDVTGFLDKVTAVIFVGGPTLIFCFGLIASVLIYLTSIIPGVLLDKLFKSHMNFLKSRMKNNDPNLEAYYQLLDDIRRGRVVITESVTENVFPVLEAPDDTVEDDATDYAEELDTEDTTDDEATETEEDTEETTDDEGTDTQDDTIEDDATDYTEELDTEDATDEEVTDDETGDTGEDPGAETTDDETLDDGTEDGATDYTEELDTEGDDTGEDTTDETDTTDDTLEDENNSQDKNSNVKNYNLMLDFEKLFKVTSDILTSLSDVVYQKPVQNKVLYRVNENMQKIRDQVRNYIEFSFSSKYEENLYHYNIFLQAIKLNLEMIKRNDQISDS